MIGVNTEIAILSRRNHDGYIVSSHPCLPWTEIVGKPKDPGVLQLPVISIGLAEIPSYTQE